MKNKAKPLFYIAMLLTGVFFFFFWGERGPVFYPDSQTYLELKSAQGVMPVYPAILKLLLYLCGQNYLMSLVVLQGILSLVCVVDFTCYIKKYFQLKEGYAFVVFLLSLLLFTIDFPSSVSSHAILTEAIAYPLFYLYMKFLFKSLFEKKKRNWLYLFLMALILSLTRSQLQLLWAVSAGFFFVGMVKQYKEGELKKYSQYLLIPAFIVLTCIIMLGGVKLTGLAAAGCNKILYGNEIKADHQGSYALWNRISYTMDEEDVNLFSDKEDQVKFTMIYQALDEAKYRYVYRPRNLWTWEHVATVACRSEFTTKESLQNYYAKKGLDKAVIEENISNDIGKMGMVLLKAHWNRYLYYTAILMIQGIVCTVFVQKASIYLLCHIIAFFLYISALVLSYICIKSSRCNSKIGYMMTVILLTSFLMNGITNLVFMGLQRYLYYIFGIFYVGYYLVLKEIFDNYLHPLLVKKRSKA